MAFPFAVQLMIGIGIGVLGFLLLRPRYRIEAPHTPHTPHNMAYDDEEQRRKFRSKPGDICIICYEVMETFDMHYLPCRHALHKKCFNLLLEKKFDSCPSCREKLQ